MAIGGKSVKLKLLAGLLSLASVASIVLYLQKSTTNTTPLESRLTQCALGKDLAVSLREPAGYECFSNLVLDAASTGKTVELQTILIENTKKDPSLYYSCHDALHAIGAVYYEQKPDIANLIRETPIDACGYAFVHGNIDAFGKDEPSEEEMYQASLACESMAVLGTESRVEGLCYHGLGHAAWLARAATYTSPEEAAAASFEYDVLEHALELCEAVITKAKASCGDGLLMDAYVPVNGIARGLENGSKELPGLCETHWKTVSQELLGGCYSGTVYIVNSKFSALLVGLNNRKESRNILTAEDEQNIWAIFEKTINMCDAVPGAYTLKHGEPLTPKDQCYSALEREVLSIIYTSEDLVDKICSRLYRFEDWCREEVAPLR